MHYVLGIMRYELCAMYYVLRMMHYTLCSMYCEVWIMYYELCTVYYVVYKMWCALCITQYAICNMYCVTRLVYDVERLINHPVVLILELQLGRFLPRPMNCNTHAGRQVTWDERACYTSSFLSPKHSPRRLSKESLPWMSPSSAHTACSASQYAHRYLSNRNLQPYCPVWGYEPRRTTPKQQSVY